MTFLHEYEIELSAKERKQYKILYPANEKACALKCVLSKNVSMGNIYTTAKEMTFKQIMKTRARLIEEVMGS